MQLFWVWGKPIVKQTQLLFRLLVVDKHLQAFQSDTGRMKISGSFFPVCVCVCGGREGQLSPGIRPCAWTWVTLHLPGAPTCRDSIHLNIYTHSHSTFSHSKWVPMGMRVSCQDLLLLRDWSWGKAVTHTLLHSSGLVTLLVRMMALSCLLFWAQVTVRVRVCVCACV